MLCCCHIEKPIVLNNGFIMTFFGGIVSCLYTVFVHECWNFISLRLRPYENRRLAYRVRISLRSELLFLRLISSILRVEQQTHTNFSVIYCLPEHTRKGWLFWTVYFYYISFSFSFLIVFVSSFILIAWCNFFDVFLLFLEVNGSVWIDAFITDKWLYLLDAWIRMPFPTLSPKCTVWACCYPLDLRCPDLFNLKYSFHQQNRWYAVLNSTTKWCFHLVVYVRFFWSWWDHFRKKFMWHNVCALVRRVCLCYTS